MLPRLNSLAYSLSLTVWVIGEFKAVGSKAAVLGNMTRNEGRWAVQGHSRSPILVSIESSYTISYWRIILTYISHHFRVVAAYGSNYRISHVVPLFSSIVQNEPLNSGPQNLFAKNLKTSLYRVVHKIFR